MSLPRQCADAVPAANRLGRTLVMLAALLVCALAPAAAMDNAAVIKMVRDGEIKNLQLLIIDGHQLQAIEDEGETPLLHIAVENGRTEVVQWLIQKHVDVNARDSSGYTALYFAFPGNQLDIINLLVNNQADIHDLEEDTKMSVLHRAAGCSRVEVVQAMLALKLDINIRDQHQRTPLQMAAYHGNVAVVQMLIDAGARLDLQDDEGETALAVAADHYSSAEESDQYQMVSMLLKAGADASIASSYGRLPQERTRSWAIYLLLAQASSRLTTSLVVAILCATVITLVPALIWRSIAKNHPVPAATRA